MVLLQCGICVWLCCGDTDSCMSDMSDMTCKCPTRDEGWTLAIVINFLLNSIVPVREVSITDIGRWQGAPSGRSLQLITDIQGGNIYSRTIKGEKCPWMVRRQEGENMQAAQTDLHTEGPAHWDLHRGTSSLSDTEYGKSIYVEIWPVLLMLGHSQVVEQTESTGPAPALWTILWLSARIVFVFILQIWPITAEPGRRQPALRLATPLCSRNTASYIHCC